MNTLSLDGKKVLLTGASSGIGRETAIQLSRLGAKIALIARREEELRLTMSRMEGNGHKFYCFDLKNIDGIEAVVNKVVADIGSLDGFVHCAGIGSNRSISLFKYENLHQIMLIHFYSYYEFVRNIQRKGNFNKGLSIVALSSIAAQFGDSAQSAYAAAKGAIDSVSHCFAKELSRKEIRVNTIAPSMIRTEMFEKYLENKGAICEEENKLLKRQYLGYGDPEDIAMAVAYLLSPISKFVTGTRMNVDGGYSSC